ncbi:MAG: type I DNA topoisomerase [Erysipelotrichaceae bacterium]|nr:type I DNA topoisomerase [Erysipelotrichaceae bacterium]
MKTMNKIKNLVIVESPSKASTIEKYLGKDYEVVASKGHINDLATSGKGHLGIDVDNGFTPTYTISSAKKSIVRQLKEEVKKADNVLLATDPDREGEAIAYHLANTLNIPLDQDNRIVFHEVTKPAVQKAISEPRKVDMDLVDSQETRRMLDRIIGFKLSTLLNSKIKSKSAGRVQSVALKLIVDREKEIAAFVPEEYWTITADFLKNKQDFQAQLTKIDGQKAEIAHEEEALKIRDDCLSNEFTVGEVTEEVKHRKPKLPYITSTLQQDAANKLNFTSKKTMSIAQRLYEGVNIGSTTTGLITYMRTDAARLSPVFMAQAREFIKDNYSEKYCGYFHQKVDKNAQDAHEAIRPTNVENTPEKIASHLTNDELKLYKMIYYRTLAAMMADALFNSRTARLDCLNYEFSATGRTLIFDGYLKVYKDYESAEDKELPLLVKDEKLNAQDVRADQHFTEPPLRYSEARLIKAMEENGIGRPSTYATIIDTIIKREYVSLQKSNEGSRIRVFVPTEQGVLTTEKLDEYFSSIINVKYTSDMEKQLDDIADGKLAKLDSLNQFYDPFMELVDNAKENMEKIAPVKVGRLCPQCGSELVERKSKYGVFIACSNYPKCKYHEDKEDENAPQEKKDYGTCPECGNPLVEKRGKYGKFIACSNYPACKYIQKKEKAAPVETGEMCPDCGSPLVKRTSRYGKEFVGCSNYPKCRYIKPSGRRKAEKAKDE